MGFASSKRDSENAMWIEVGGFLVGLLLVIRKIGSTSEAAPPVIRRAPAKLPPASSITDAPDGKEVSITGTVSYVDQHATLTAPFSGRPCAAWRVVIERETGVRAHMAAGQAAESFILQDDTGRALVDEDADLFVEYDWVEGPAPVPKVVEAFLRTQGRGILVYPTRERVIAREGILAEGDLITVAGVGTWMNDPGTHTGYRGHGQLLRVQSSKYRSLVVVKDRTELSGSIEA